MKEEKKQYRKHCRGTYQERQKVLYQRRIDDALNKSGISKEQQKTLKLFLLQKASEECKISTLSNYAKFIAYFGKALGKPFEKAEQKDLVKYFASIKDKKGLTTVTKLTLKVFYKYLQPQKRKKDYPEIVDWIVVKRKAPDDTHEILTPSDVKKLVSKARCRRDRVFILALFASGARLSEILSTNTSDFKVNEHGVEMNIRESKTKRRKIQLLDGAEEIVEYLNTHPYKDEADKPMFYKDKPFGEALGFSGAKKLLRETAKRAGLYKKKKTNAHWFRHSRLSLEAVDMPESALRVFAGWSKSSDMPSRYVHLKDADVTNIRLIKRGLIDANGEEVKDESLRGVVCPKCKTKHSGMKDICEQCLQPLTQQGVSRFKSSFEGFIKVADVMAQAIGDGNVDKKMAEAVALQIKEFKKEMRVE